MNLILVACLLLFSLANLASSAGYGCSKCELLFSDSKYGHLALYYSKYPSCLGDGFTEAQDILNALYFYDLKCDGCTGYYASKMVSRNLSSSYLSHPPSMYYWYNVYYTADDSEIYPEGYFLTACSDGIFPYENWLTNMKSFIGKVSASYGLESRLNYLATSQHEGYWLYQFSLVKTSAFHSSKYNFSRKFDLRSLKLGEVKHLGQDLHNVVSLSSISQGETRIGIIVETNRHVRQLLSSALQYLEKGPISPETIEQKYFEFIAQSERLSAQVYSDAIRLFITLFDLESTIQLDATWINTYLIIGYVESSLNYNASSQAPADANIVADNNYNNYNNSIFCETIRLVVPRLFSVLVSCSSYKISSNTCYLENDLNDMVQNRCENSDGNKVPDIVRNEVTKLYIRDSSGGISLSLPFINYFVYINDEDKSRLPGEGWLRSSVFHFQFNTVASGYGALVLSTLLADDTHVPPLPISSIVVARTFLESLESVHQGASTATNNGGGGGGGVDLLFSKNSSRSFNDVVFLWSLSTVGILKAYQYDALIISTEKFIGSLDSANMSTANDEFLRNKVSHMTRIFANSLYDRYWIDGDLNTIWHEFNIKNEQKANKGKPRIVYITAVYGNYELSCKRHAYQTVASDFICFTDNPNIVANNWIVDTTPYHALFWQEQMNSDFAYFKARNISKEEILGAKNSYNNNMHPFNIAKFYKTNFPWIPRLKGYDIVVWLDGTISVHSSEVSSRLQGMIGNGISADGSVNGSGRGESVITFDLRRWGSLKSEAEMSMLSEKYTATSFNNIAQPMQSVDVQFEAYLLSGYDDEGSYWGKGGRFEQRHHERLAAQPGQLDRPHRGVFCTCFIAYDMRNATSSTSSSSRGADRSDVRDLLALWFEQILFLSTQDQVSFPFVAQKLETKIFSLPDDTVMYGEFGFNEWFNKLNHGL